MTEQEKLLKKYYSGESSLEEEKALKSIIAEGDSDSTEQAIFGYFKNESTIPDDLEESIFSSLENDSKKKKTIRMRLFGISSAAAVILIFLSVYIDIRNTKNTKMENDFFVMEQALFQVSESIQPDVQEEMLVLWVDDDVEIIIN